jgi:chemotaxis protein histidine kinase CheA
MSAPIEADGGLPDPEEAFRRRCRRDRARLDALHHRIAVADAEPPDAALAELQEVAHGLYGAGGTFGFDGISAAAGGLELMVEDFRAAGCREWPTQRGPMTRAAAELLHALCEMRQRP